MELWYVRNQGVFMQRGSVESLLLLHMQIYDNEQNDPFRGQFSVEELLEAFSELVSIKKLVRILFKVKVKIIR